MSAPGRVELAIVVVAKAPRPGLAKTRLEPLLGPDGCARLQAALIARAARWAVEHAAPGAAYLAHAPADAAGELAPLVPGGVELLPQPDGHLGTRLEAAFTAAAERSGRPTVLVGTDAPTLSGHHARAVREDLAAGADVAIGAANDGGWYLIAARRPHPALFAIDPQAWGGDRVMGLTLESLARAGLEIGMLRSERDLDVPADAAALLADPLAPADVAAELRGGP
ncbi:MAG TPA: TIGR04282 family arsenosugar biosynthesis glycosyltransferase [Capillimicrobium sp.]